MEMKTQQLNIDAWQDFITTRWINAAALKKDEDVVVCTGVRGSTTIVESTQKEKKVIILEVDYYGQHYDFQLNNTNRDKILMFCPGKPTDIIGKKIWLKKALAINPTTKKEVEVIRISKVEN